MCVLLLLNRFVQPEAGNITNRTLPIGTTTYSYDALNRLTSEAGPAGTQNYTYDANGNRTSDASGTYTYSPTGNRMLTRRGVAVTVDAAGNITSDGVRSYTYNEEGRLTQFRKNNVLLASYYYNDKGERTRKVTTAATPQGAQTILYVYDLSGHLLAELTGTGAPLRTYVWRDDVPLAQIDHTPARRILYFDVDQLNTPRAARDQSGNIAWRWESDAFGSTLPNENPYGAGIVTVNLRFPGQYYDQESGLHYNGQRYYDPATGQYTQSDPIGLAGGTFSTYAYTGGNPLRWSDPLGLSSLVYQDGTLTVVGSNGNVVGTYPAGNNTTNPSGDPNTVGSNGPAPQGTFPVQSPVDTTGRPEYGSTFFPVGAVGSNGQRLDIARQRGIGVHSGRRGYQSKTQGCIRVDESTIQDLLQINQYDPITEITIQ